MVRYICYNCLEQSVQNCEQWVSCNKCGISMITMKEWVRNKVSEITKEQEKKENSQWQTLE